MMVKSKFLQATATSTGVNRLPERSEISTEYQWRVEDIFESDEEWQRTYSRVEEMIPEVGKFRGKLSKSAENLLNCLRLRDRIEETFSKLYIYAGLKNDEDSRVPTYQAFRDRAASLMVKINQESSFIQPEILAIPDETLTTFLEGNRELQAYRHHLDDLIRSRPHVLPPEQERLLAMTGEIAQAPYNIFSMFNNADIKFPSIRDEDGNEVEVTKGRYSRLMESHDRRVRKAAFDAMYSTYGHWTNTLAATLSSVIKKNIFYGRVRNYNTALDAALDSDNVPLEVYENVVGSINRNLGIKHRYMRLRKKMLGLDKLHPWDLYVPLVNNVKFDISYEKALELIREALAPLGDDYLAVLQKSFQEGWIDVYENVGKRSGAYSWSTYGAHPYVLLNYNNTLNNVFTVTHELGHALHSHYSHKHQPYHYSHYTIFVAEVASTLNEALLMDHLLKNTEDRRKKLFLLNEYIDQIRSTVYIQALFAEFEKMIHEKSEKGEALTAESLNEMTRELYLRYFGPEFEMDDEYHINWCRIPHFYYNFYVYKYVTGYSAATAISQQILRGNTGARDAYLRFLTRGSSDYSMNLLKDAGVDMTSPQPIEATTKLMNRLMDEMESLIGE